MIYYEVGNALRYFEDVTQTDIIEALHSLIKMQILLIYFEEDLIEKITKIAFLNNLTIYDSCYCALAEKYGYKLI